MLHESRYIYNLGQFSYIKEKKYLFYTKKKTHIYFMKRFIFARLTDKNRKKKNFFFILFLLNFYKELEIFSKFFFPCL